ncbi:MAG: hypothetical protein CML22_07345 [Rheinheimera sp.]|nr:hypothetical protein [Rheinheimera sp.]MBM34098.1 hypothetical protein [Rheinheimera sp.]
MEKHLKLVYLGLIVLLVIVVNIAITRMMQQSQLTLIIETLNVPRIMTIDMDEVVKQRLDDGATPSEVLAYVDNINKAMHHRNVILLDKNAAVSIPDGYKLETVSPTQLNAYLTENNIVPSEAAAFDQQIQQTSKELQDLLKL